MPPTLSTSWDDSASSAESDDYGDVFGTTVSSFGAFWIPVGLFWLPGGFGLSELGCGLCELAPLTHKVHGQEAPNKLPDPRFGTALGGLASPKASKSTSQGTKMDPISELFGETLWTYAF